MKRQYLPRFIKNISNFKVVQALLRMTVEGYYYNNGWIDSLKAKRPIDINGQALPWLTYPFIDFLNERINPAFNIFEFGAGNSTLYFAPRVNSVISVENDKGWFDTLRKMLPENANVNFEANLESGAYAAYINQFTQRFNLILVDGRDRVNCCKQALTKLTDNGVLILDNSDRNEYKEVFTFYALHNFKHLNFWGTAPGYIDRSCTTVFYKEHNCLGI